MAPWTRLAAGVMGLWAACAAPALGQSCDVTYTTVDGDTLFSVAEAHYQDYEKWSLIYYSNQGLGLEQPLAIPAGTKLYIPCLEAEATPDATPLQQSDAELRFLTGSNYAPFTDKNWPGQGLITELVNAIMEETPNPVPYAVDWEDDWSKHLFPLLDEAKYDMGFPWLKPDCAADPANERCANFHFSDPLFEMPIQLFVKADADFTFDSDADVEGKTLCRPKGYYTHDLDAQGRNWLKEGKITLVTPDTPDECFTMLVAGEVDAVPENLFLGADKINAMGLRGKVKPLERPLSTETLHVIVSKKHWRGTTFLYRINAGLAKIKADGRYDEIVKRHLAVFMEQLKKN
jgi:polar amino acid transport system substrate-binding protein